MPAKTIELVLAIELTTEATEEIVLVNRNILTPARACW